MAVIHHLHLGLSFSETRKEVSLTRRKITHLCGVFSSGCVYLRFHLRAV